MIAGDPCALFLHQPTSTPVLLDRYLIRETSASFVTVASVLIAIFLAYSLTRFLTDAAEGLLQAREVAELTLYKSLIALEVLLPLAFYFGLIIAFGRLNLHNEITAIRAGGMQLLRAHRPLIVLGLLLAALVAALSLNVRPWAYNRIFELRDSARAASELDRIKPRRFYTYEGGNRTVYVEEAAADGRELGGVFIRTNDDGALEIISAPRGELEAFVSADRHRLTLTQASIFRSAGHDADLLGRFDALVLSLDAQRDIAFEYRTKSAATGALLASVQSDDRAELQWRLSTPVSTVLLTLTALLLTNARPREGRFARLPLAIGIYAVYYNLLGVARTWVEQESFVTLWWAPAVYAVLLAGFVLVRRRRTWPA